MSKLVIIGGHDCMVCKYKEVCKQYDCKAKVFTQVPGNLKQQIGNPDMMVLFTNTIATPIKPNSANSLDLYALENLRCSVFSKESFYPLPH